MTKKPQPKGEKQGKQKTSAVEPRLGSMDQSMLIVDLSVDLL
jgi:hypothetical protein